MAKSTEDMLTKIVDKLDELQKSMHSQDKDLALQKAVAVEQHGDIKAVQEEQKRTNDILQKNTESLNEHMHRTDLLEKMVANIDGRLTPIEIDRIEKEAIAKHRAHVMKQAAKWIGAIATLIGIVAASKPLLLFLLTL